MNSTLCLSRQDVASLLSLEECIPALEVAFTAQASGRDGPPALLGLHTKLGGLHVKAAVITQDRPYLVAKANANFPGNHARFGLPTIQGLILLVDGENGRLLALMDSIEVTISRTAATTALAARHLARPEAAILALVGCGVQGKAHVHALRHVLPLRRVHLFDCDPAQIERLKAELSALRGLEIDTITDLAAAVKASDVCVTCTSSRAPIVTSAMLSPGLFIAAVGADSHDKQELEPAILAAATLVVDHTEQCATIGELHHALSDGIVSRAAVHAELPEVVAGRRPGRTRASEITIFDSTGTATQDAAAALLVYRKALDRGIGRPLNLNG